MTRLQRRHYTRWVKWLRGLNLAALLNVFRKRFNTGRPPGKGD